MSSNATTPPTPNLVLDLLRLLRPVQWSKGVFVLVGPAYALATGGVPGAAGAAGADERVRVLTAALGAFVAFALASSGCYIVNDLKDRRLDALHPRKRFRPLAAGRVSVAVAAGLAVLCWLLAAASVAVMIPDAPGMPPGQTRWLLGAAVGAYVINVVLYSLGIKRLVVADTISLATGFVLRVLGGCAAAGVEPSSWLLNVTFFLSMFLALGKRLGERRTMGGGDQAALARGVQAKYTDELLRMGVVVTAVATLVSYSDYVQAQGFKYTLGFNLLWLTMLPATYGLLRCIVLVERGVYDDPTELAVHDRAFQLSGVAFAFLTAVVMLGSVGGYIKVKVKDPAPLGVPGGGNPPPGRTSNM